MKNNIKLIVILALAALVFACESYDFEQEQYRNDVGLLSNSDLVYDRQTADLWSNGDTLFLVASLSGSQAPKQAVNVAIKEADSLFHAFNKSNYDIDESRFAKLLPKACYSLPEDEKQIAAGTFRTQFPVYLKNLDKLSPDTIYFLNFKIDSLRTTAYDEKKKEVLFRIYKQNEFASTRTNTSYTYTSSYVTPLEPGGVANRPTHQNRLFPLGQDSVRMLAGDENYGDYKDALDNINRMSIKVTVGGQTPYNPAAREVVITPYRTIDVVQLPPSGIYDNTYLINVISTPDGRSTYYKEFRLYYKYRLSSLHPYKEVKAILRMDYNPREELL